MPDGPFASDRTRHWRQSDLRDFNRKEIESIEEFGHQILSVAGESRSQNFAYTFGLFDNSGLPEILVVGLRHETAFALLETSAARMRAGTDLLRGRHSGLLAANVACEFRPIDPKWIKRLMLGATWFYKGTKFPAIQAVYPDLENRLPEDAGFDTTFAQPLLQPSQPFGPIEQDFWRAQGREEGLSG